MIGRHRAYGRIAWMVLTILIVQGAASALAALPIVAGWSWLLSSTGGSTAAGAVLRAAALVPSYVLFALLLMFTSGLATRLAGWHTPAGLAQPIRQYDWPLLQWARCMVATHLVRLIAGSLFRATPCWTAYLRLAGARIGRRVSVNSLSLADYNLLEFGDDVVIGEHVHLSGHTVERGLLRTAPVRVGRGSTIGTASIIDIGVTIGDGCEVGAMSLVPKFARLEAGGVYVGVPARPLARPRPRLVG